MKRKAKGSRPTREREDERFMERDRGRLITGAI